MSNAFSGVGTVLYREDPSTHAWAAIGEVKNISGPSMSKDQIDVTSLNSTGGYREFIAGFINAGEVTFTMNMDHAGYAKLLSDFQSSSTRNYKIVLPNDEESTLSFAALTTGMPMNITSEDAVTIDVTLLVSGPTTFYSGASTTSTTTT